MQETKHVFGMSDELVLAQDYPGASKLRVRVLSFVGRELRSFRGRETKAGHYKVEVDGIVKSFYLSNANERLAHAVFKVEDYNELVGKELRLLVKKYPVGLGFVLTGIESPRSISPQETKSDILQSKSS